VNPLHFGFDGSISHTPTTQSEPRNSWPRPGTERLRDHAEHVQWHDHQHGQMADAVTGYLAKVGTKVRRRHIEDVGMWTTSGKEGKLEGIQYYSWVPTPSSMRCRPVRPDVLQEPLSYTKDAALDQLLDEGRTQIDPKKRQEAYAKAQKLIHEKFYWIPINVQYTIEGVNKKLNYEAGSDEMMRVYSASWKD